MFWNSLSRPGWFETHRDPPALPPYVGIIGMYHHIWLTLYTYLYLKYFAPEQCCDDLELKELIGQKQVQTFKDDLYNPGHYQEACGRWLLSLS